MCITDFLENGHIFGELEKKFFSLRLLTNVIEYSEEFILECWDRGSAQTEGTLKGSIGKTKCFHSLEEGVFLKTAHGKNCRSCKFFLEP